MLIDLSELEDCRLCGRVGGPDPPVLTTASGDGGKTETKIVESETPELDMFLVKSFAFGRLNALEVSEEIEPEFCGDTRIGVERLGECEEDVVAEADRGRPESSLSIRANDSDNDCAGGDVAVD